MTRDVRLSAKELEKLKLQPHSRAAERVRPLEKYQIFEVVTAAVFARLKPDYLWSVSPNRADGGVDFVGRGPFLKSDILGIDASILIGGECKKRSGRQALEDLSGSLIKMCDTLRPTFIVGVISAPVTTLKIEEAKHRLERVLHRHCHIFGRNQIETILARQMDILSAVLKEALEKKVLEPQEVEKVLQYFRNIRGPALEIHISLDPISAVMGWSFSVSLEIHHTSPGLTVQLRWLPADATFIRLIAPCGADAPLGSHRTLGSDIVAPFVDHLDIEFVTYRVGESDLGALEITASDGETATVALPKVEVAPDLRPSFYARPYQGVMDDIAEAFALARSGRPMVVAVTGSGGAGKTRMCQETAIEARRQGADFIAAQQPNSSERPYRLFADLLLSLTADRSIGRRSPADPTEVLARLQPELAERATPAIRALVESAGLTNTDDQVLLSAFILLISAKSRNVPLVIHLQNLHWCTQDALEFIERLIWQLQQIADSSAVSGSGVPVRVLFLLEGRTHEQRAQVDAGWSTRAFERSLDRIRCTRLSCTSFDRLQSTEFVERLFETAGSAVRQIPDAVLPLQKPILDAIVRASGGNPFHILEQVRWLRQQNILAINPRSGLLYLLRPPVGALALPLAVADIIHARWRYWAEQFPAVGRLVLAAALFEDRLPALLFRHLWRTLAPEASRQQLEGLELFRFPRGSVGSDDFAFAHENYFHALGGLILVAEDHKAILRAYLDWFANRSEQDPELLFIHARALLHDESADRCQVETLLRKVVSLSNEQRKQALAARATAVLLDEIAWPLSRSRGGDHEKLVEACEDELALSDYLIMSGNRNLAQERMELALGHLSKVLAYDDDATAPDAVKRCRLLLGAMLARTLFNNGAPVRAASITEDLVADVRHLVPDPHDEDPTRRSLLMEILHTHAVATALAGEISVALLASAHAAAIAETLIGHDQRPLEVISTHGNIAIADSPSLALNILTACAPHAIQADPSSRLRLRLEINTAMARIVMGYDARASDPEDAAADLRPAADAMRAAYRRANTVGRHSDAAAAALLLGLALTLLGEDARTKFADAVAAASRAGQLETLWRAQINLAHSLNAAGESPLESAAAALAILTGTLESSAEADTSPRYRMVAAPLAQATLYCLRAGDPRGAAALRRFPALANMFSDSPSTRLRDDRGGFRSREWLQVGDVDYVLY